MNPYEIEGVQPGEFITIKADHPITSFVAVSSTVAERWLAHNTHNRPLSEDAVMQYQGDMEAGRFKMTGEPIQFSRSGVLLNGQNRLTALSNALPPMTLVFNVIRGLDDDVQSFMDLGKKRTPGQQLNLLNIKNANQIASVARLLITWEHGLLWRENKVRRAISTPQVEQWALENGKLVDVFNRYLAHTTRAVGAQPSVSGAMAIAGLRIDPQATIAFFSLLAKRINLPEGSPLLALDSRLRRTRAERKRIPQREELAYFIQAWNQWMRGESVAKLQSGRGGWNSTNFPSMETTRGRRFDTEQLAFGLELGGYEA
jgi:hypothetical protein